MSRPCSSQQVEGVTEAVMIKVVSLFEQFGLVKWHGNRADKRVVLVGLTAFGANYFATRWQADARQVTELVTRMSVRRDGDAGSRVPEVVDVRRCARRMLWSQR
jgi:hypothetical protein